MVSHCILTLAICLMGPYCKEYATAIPLPLHMPVTPNMGEELKDIVFMFDCFDPAEGDSGPRCFLSPGSSLVELFDMRVDSLHVGSGDPSPVGLEAIL